MRHKQSKLPYLFILLILVGLGIVDRLQAGDQGHGPDSLPGGADSLRLAAESPIWVEVSDD